MSVIANVVSWFAAALDITQFLDQIRMKLISNLIYDIWRVLQILPKFSMVPLF